MAVARALAERLGGRATVHDRFGTATVRADADRADVARTRREVYERPGALPEVEPAVLEEDLRRRDFTSTRWPSASPGEDLGTLHDPARRSRGPRRRADPDPPPGQLPRRSRPACCGRCATRAGSASHSRARPSGSRARPRPPGRPRRVSGARIADELMDLLAEAEAPRSVARLAELGLDRALHPEIVADADLVTAAQLGALESGATRPWRRLRPSACEGLHWPRDLGLGGPPWPARLRSATPCCARPRAPRASRRSCAGRCATPSCTSS